MPFQSFRNSPPINIIDFDLNVVQIGPTVEALLPKQGKRYHLILLEAKTGGGQAKGLNQAADHDDNHQ
jgi:hypothetical protein